MWEAEGCGADRVLLDRVGAGKGRESRLEMKPTTSSSASKYI